MRDLELKLSKRRRPDNHREWYWFKLVLAWKDGKDLPGQLPLPEKYSEEEYSDWNNWFRNTLCRESLRRNLGDTYDELFQLPSSAYESYQDQALADDGSETSVIDVGG